MDQKQQRQSGRKSPNQQLVGEEKQFDERVLHIDRVARVVKGGRRFRFRALVVVGDHKGRVGVATSKGADVTAAVAKAVDTAKKNLMTVNLYNGTFPHDAQAKVGGANILLKPASAGTGLIAGGVVRTILEVAGVSNALSKSLGSSNKVNISYATVDALKTMESADKWVTRSTTQAKKPVKKAEEVEKTPEKSEKKAPAKKPTVKKTTTKKAK
ncbi:30S ribosomal protein S5 [Candidatus Saccharibacteria bacterium]|nr:30S ribosomal protein S5 [Candidatus Saccharibacteria bacterium]